MTTCIVGGLAGRPRARSCHHEGDPPTHGRDPFPDPGYGIGRAIRPRALATRPCRHVRSRRTETAGSRGACGRARAVAWRASCAPRNDRSASSLAGRPCLIIGVRECRHGTGNIVRRASVEATSVVGDRARVRRFRRIRSRPHKWTTSPDSGRTGGSLRASRIASPHWGQIGAASGFFPNEHRS